MFEEILKVPSTFIDRTNSNRVVLEKGTELLYPNQGDQRKFKLFSQFYHDRKTKLLGHVLRAGDDDPLVKFSSNKVLLLEYNTAKKESVALGNTGCIMPKNTRSNISLVATSMKKWLLKMHASIMQP